MVWRYSGRYLYSHQATANEYTASKLYTAVSLRFLINGQIVMLSIFDPQSLTLNTIAKSYSQQIYQVSYSIWQTIRHHHHAHTQYYAQTVYEHNMTSACFQIDFFSQFCFSNIAKYATIYSCTCTLPFARIILRLLEFILDGLLKEYITAVLHHTR